MPINAVAAILNNFVPSTYYIPLLTAVGGIYAARVLAQGRKTTRERDLHGRIILITGAFTPLGLQLVQSLAERGAHVIALSPEPITSPRVDLLVDALRGATKNEKIFAEQCDLESATSVREFCTRFLTGNETRLDAIVFTHEYHHVGALFSKPSEADDARRHAMAMATFLIITLLLPVFLVAPSERDIRIVNVCNPFYAAAVPGFSASVTRAPSSSSVFYKEGLRSLRAVLLTRHLQRVLDALPNRTQAPQTEGTQEAIPVVSASAQKSNIVAVTVSPGFSRMDTVTPLLGPDVSNVRFVLYLLFYPLIYLLSKASGAAVQTVLHALFLPTPFKAIATSSSAPRRTTDSDPDSMPEEVLKPGALYRECAVVRLPIPHIPIQVEAKGTKSAKGKEKEDIGEPMPMPDDGEMGGLGVGTAVWESFEAELKEWDPTSTPDTKDSSDQSVNK